VTVPEMKISIKGYGMVIKEKVKVNDLKVLLKKGK
jgi:hypothetical protein